MKFGGPDKGEKEEIELFKLNKYLLNTVDYEKNFYKKKTTLKYTRMEAKYSKKTLKTVAYLY